MESLRFFHLDRKYQREEDYLFVTQSNTNQDESAVEMLDT